jgi:integrase
MPRLPINVNPSLRRHRASGQGIVTLNGKDHYLGVWPLGQKKPPELVQSAYDQLIAEWRANGRQPVVRVQQDPGLTVGELILRHWPHVEEYYRHPDGTPTGEAKAIRLALRPLRKMYESLPAAEFSPLKLEAVRETMIRDGRVRTLLNSRVGKIVRMFKWAVSKELVPETVHRALTAVEGLKEGRSPAPEGEPVCPVADALVDATLPYLLPPVAAMVRLMRLTGMRCGEACRMRACDLDVSGPVWLYQPMRHKTSHQGKSRVIPLGPKAQEIARPFLTTELQAPIFSPRRALEERSVLLRAGRRTKVQPSQMSRRRAKRKRAPGEWYTSHTVAVAIRRACERADRRARQEAENAQAKAEGRQAVKAPATVPEGERLVRHWHPHQLRHAHATEVRKRYGLDAARTALGHSGASITELYAERDLDLAENIAAQVG